MLGHEHEAALVFKTEVVHRAERADGRWVWIVAEHNGWIKVLGSGLLGNFDAGMVGRVLEVVKDDTAGLANSGGVELVARRLGGRIVKCGLVGL